MKENRKEASSPSHWGEDGKLRMVDVSEKPPTLREARASGKILVREETLALVRAGKTPKGDIFTVSQIAGIQAAKQTPALIPMCHPLPITHCRIEFRLEKDGITAETTVRTKSRTGVEMEALVGTAAALLSVYDMLKPVDKTMVITDIELQAKSGGKSGDWKK